jgi:hypothetical protein
MKGRNLLFIILFAGCNTGDQQSSMENKADTIRIHDTVFIEKTGGETPTEKPSTTLPSKTYSNERFKEVTVEKTSDHKFLIKGKGQIFEAAFSWVVEDGHDELKKGFTMTDAGAPAWGNFSFTVDAPKKRANSTLHLILFESSPKDGSRQYELPILLY